MTKRYLQHIVWDWNGTLLDDVAASVDAINHMLRKRNLPLTSVETYRATFGFPVFDYYRQTGFHLELENWDALAIEFHRLFLASPYKHVRPESYTTLKQCARAGLSMQLLSAAEQSMLNTMVRDAGLVAFFDNIIGTDNLDGASKEEQGKMLAQRIAARCDQILMIGDTLHDYEIAARLGWHCVLVAGGHQSRQRISNANCPVLDSIADIPEWLKMFDITANDNNLK